MALPRLQNLDLGGIDLGLGILPVASESLSAQTPQKKEFLRKLQKSYTQSGGQGLFVDEQGDRFHRFAAARIAANNNLIDPTEYLGGSDNPHGTNFPDYRSPLTESGLSFIGEGGKGLKEFERTRKQQASTALFAAGNVSDAKGSGAFSLTAESAGAIRRDTQLGLGGSGRGKIVLG